MKRKFLLIFAMLACVSMLSACSINMGAGESSSESNYSSDTESGTGKDGSEEVWTGIHKP